MNGLVTLSQRVAELRELAAAQRRSAVQRLLPELRKLVADVGVTAENRINLLVRAGRAIDPRLARADTPADALAALEELAAAKPAPGQPPIGPPTTIRFTQDSLDGIGVYARRQGHVDKDGEPRVAATVREMVDDRLKDLGLL